MGTIVRIRDWFLKTPHCVALSVDASCGLDEPHLISKKELAYPGTFVKVDDSGETQFELPVDESLLEHWVRTFDEMKRDGIPVPVPIGHTTDPEARRGTVVKMAVEPSDHPARLGQPALFCYIRWRKPEYKEQFKESDVSLFMPHQFTSGVGKRYNRPIRHTAITDYPVVPSLSKFSDIAASLNDQTFELSFIACDQESKEKSMATPALQELAQEMGVECPEGCDDATLKQSIMQAWNSQVGGGEGGEMPPDETLGGEEEMPSEDYGGEEEMPPEEYGEEEEPEMSEAEGMGAGVPEEVYEGGGDGGSPRRRHDRNYEPAPAMSYGIPISLTNQLVRSRRLELKELSTGPKPRITPAVAKALDKLYCTQQAVGFSLSHEVTYPGEKGDDFDAVVAALSLNAPIANVGERTQAQQSENHGGNGQPAILKDAEARQRKHDARHRRLR